MTNRVSETVSHSSADQSVVDWDRALRDYSQPLRKLVSARLSGRGESAVDDVLQEVVLAAHAAPEGSVAPENTEAWLKQVAINKVRDLWRKLERKDRLMAGLAQGESIDLSNTRSPFEWVMAIEQTQLINQALDQLSEDERRIIEKKYLDGQSCGDIALEEGMKPKAIEYRLKKAREAMRSILNEVL